MGIARPPLLLECGDQTKWWGPLINILWKCRIWTFLVEPFGALFGSRQLLGGKFGHDGG